MWQDNFQHQYGRLRKVLLRRASLARFYVNIFLPLVFWWCFLYSLVMISDVLSRPKSEISDPLPYIAPYLPYAFTAVILGFVLFSVKWIVKREQSLEKNKFLREITDEPSVQRVRSDVETVAQRLGIDSGQLHYWLSRRDSGAVPSIITRQEAIHFVLPLGFLKLQAQRPDLAQALIAHELGHVFNKDADNLLKTWAFMHIGYGILMPLNIIALVVDFGALAGLRGQVPSASLLEFGLLRCLTLTLNLLFLYRLRQFHFISERLADGVSLSLNQSETLKEALLTVADSKTYKGLFWNRIVSIHPSLRVRLYDIDRDGAELHKAVSI